MKVLIENISKKMTEDKFLSLFEEMKGFIQGFINRDKYGESEGFGYVYFEHLSDGRRAIIKFNGCEINGRVLKLNQVNSFPHPFIIR